MLLGLDLLERFSIS